MHNFLSHLTLFLLGVALTLGLTKPESPAETNPAPNVVSTTPEPVKPTIEDGISFDTEENARLIIPSHVESSSGHIKGINFALMGANINDTKQLSLSLNCRGGHAHLSGLTYSITNYAERYIQGNIDASFNPNVRDNSSIDCLFDVYYPSSKKNVEYRVSTKIILSKTPPLGQALDSESGE
jgi:hypothetical protein